MAALDDVAVAQSSSGPRWVAHGGVVGECSVEGTNGEDAGSRPGADVNGREASAGM